ncbi:ferritin-like domain-containing protein [Iamia majanohamensis]|uniref:Ferritin-like domain-containing protein n=1 Tax=Iamia majanohamensis TaxID=467976 RepID=A0AAE9Y3B6_9ACTN|nr:ferritin-like domain-containing protein [Iamia majanohamensis]WCO65660.1 ferritin-like domain-containing protein [Iamia majanohamensis]
MPDMHPDDIDALVHEARQTPRSALDRWRRSSARVLARSDDGPTSPDGRRQFLRLGGGGVLAAAVLAACGSSEEVPPAETGTTTPEQATTTIGPAQTTSPEDGAAQDAAVTRTHRTFELAAVEIYAVLLDDDAGLGEATTELRLPGPIDYDGRTTEALELLQARHTSHAAYLESVVAAAGGEPVDEPNRGVLEGLLGPVVLSLTTERAVVQFMSQLETIGAATYAWGTGTMTSASLRQSLMTVGAIAGRQAAIPALLLEPDGSTAIEAGVLDTSGPARLPEQMLVLDGMDGGDTAAEPPDPAASTDGEDGEGDDAEAEGE